MTWVVEEFGDKLLTKEGVRSTSEVLAGKKLIGIYFSAHWCPPCRGFTPNLVSFYNDVKALGADELELVFVSSDSDETSYREYYGSMSFVAVPYEARDIKDKLANKYGVRGIPTLIILDANGNLKDGGARGTVMSNMDNVQAALSSWA